MGRSNIRSKSGGVRISRNKTESLNPMFMTIREIEKKKEVGDERENFQTCLEHTLLSHQKHDHKILPFSEDLPSCLPVYFGEIIITNCIK